MISRLRLHLAAWFAVVFLAGLAGADVILFTVLQGAADRRLTTQTTASAEGIAAAVVRELGVRNTFPEAAAEALAEWPADSAAFVIFDSRGARIADRGPSALLGVTPGYAALPSQNRTWDVPFDAEGNVRLALVRDAGVGFSAIALLSTAGVREANERLAFWLFLSTPLVILLALAGGYMLARRALVPLRSMTESITALAPGNLDRRLPVRSPPDELDSLAEQFNQLLQRLSDAQARNRRFLAQAAHQLRTPLTVIRGESSLGLERPRTVDEYRDMLRRVSRASEQMMHRVDDLFLLAQAEAGDQPPLVDDVDVDGLALECTDLMRGRADALGHRLALGTMDPAQLTGNEALIREAVLELLENACRHGAAGDTIRVATFQEGAAARIEIASAGDPVPPASLNANGRARGPEHSGLGLPIVRWIAQVHGGRLDYRHEAGINTFALVLNSAVPQPAG